MVAALNVLFRIMSQVGDASLNNSLESQNLKEFRDESKRKSKLACYNICTCADKICTAVGAFFSTMYLE